MQHNSVADPHGELWSVPSRAEMPQVLTTPRHCTHQSLDVGLPRRLCDLNRGGSCMPDRAVLLEARRRASRASEHSPHYAVNAQQRVAVDTYHYSYWP